MWFLWRLWKPNRLPSKKRLSLPPQNRWKKWTFSWLKLKQNDKMFKNIGIISLHFPIWTNFLVNGSADQQLSCYLVRKESFCSAAYMLTPPSPQSRPLLPNLSLKNASSLDFPQALPPHQVPSGQLSIPACPPVTGTEQALCKYLSNGLTI